MHKKGMSAEPPDSKPKLQELGWEEIEQVSGGAANPPPPPPPPPPKPWGIVIGDIH